MPTIYIYRAQGIIYGTIGQIRLTPMQKMALYASGIIVVFQRMVILIRMTGVIGVYRKRLRAFNPEKKTACAKNAASVRLFRWNNFHTSMARS